MDKEYGVIYKVTNLINGKVYVGQTVNFEKRKYDHIRDALKGINTNKKFYNAIRKYGADSFKWEIIDEADMFINEETLSLKEIYWITYFNSYVDEKGYNMTRGGDGGNTLGNHPNKKEIYKKSGNTLKTKIKNETPEERIVRKNYYKNRSKNLTPKFLETVRKHAIEWGAYQKDKHFEELYGEEKSNIIKKKISNASKGENNPFYGKTHTEETRKMMMAGHKEYYEKIFLENRKIHEQSILYLYYKDISIKNISLELNIGYTLVKKIIKLNNLPIGVKGRGLNRGKSKKNRQ